jgi:hypothetical protein
VEGATPPLSFTALDPVEVDRSAAMQSSSPVTKSILRADILVVTVRSRDLLPHAFASRAWLTYVGVSAFSVNGVYSAAPRTAI